jgi:hypothetical protein
MRAAEAWGALANREMALTYLNRALGPHPKIDRYLGPVP